MAFLIRHISLTADGREIVRDARLDREAIQIGRAAENEIALPDLSVAPQHARIVRRDDRRIAVSATGTLGFVADGRTVTRADIDAARGAELGFGGHRITVTRDAQGDVVLSVRRVEAVSEAEEERDEARAFSLRGKLPGKRMTAWLLLAAVLVGFLAVPIWGYWQKQAGQRSIYAAGADTSWSSGPLSDAHHSLEGKCESCHEKAFVSVRDSACVACHKDAHDHADPKKLAAARAEPTRFGRFLQGVARTFGKPEPGGCVDCHSEHEGAGPMQATAQAFCSDCHAGLSKRVAGTKLPDAGDFGTAHPEFRPAFRSGGDRLVRASLAAGPAEANGLKFPHDLHLDRRGGVARMAQTLKGRSGFGDALECKDCHTPTADGTRFLPVTMEKNCQMCHSLAFDRIGGTVRTLRHGDVAQMAADLRAFYRSTPAERPAELGGMARRRPGQYAQNQVYGAYFGSAAQRAGRGDGAVRAVFSPGGACGECHTVTPPVAGRDWSVMPVHQPARYMLHGWFDHGAHRAETCASCHSADRSSSAADLILPGIKTCRTCHGGESASAPVPSGCAMCHSYHLADGAPWVPKRQVARRN